MGSGSFRRTSECGVPGPLRFPNLEASIDGRVILFQCLKEFRFAYQNTYYSPALTPALTYASSIPSSSGLITPPSTGRGLPGPSPFTIAYGRPPPVKHLPYAGPVGPHRLLSTVNWDLMEHSSTITRNNRLSRRTLDEQATSPSLPFLSITSSHLPWTIEVHASNGSYVTLRDVFDSIYHSLRVNIASTEFNLFPRKEDQQRAARAYEQRYKRFRNATAYDEEKRAGMKRIDFFMGHTIFHGISHTGGRPDEWQLHVA